MSGNFGPGQPRVPEPSRGMTYERLTRNDLPVVAVDIITDRLYNGMSPRALDAIRAATGIADVSAEPVGDRHTRVTLRPTRREAVSLITSAVYSDVINGVNQ